MIYSRPLSVPFLLRTSGKGTDVATPLGLEKYGRIDFALKKWTNGVQKRPKVGGPMLRSHGNLSDFVHYLGRTSHFSEGHQSVCCKKYLNPHHSTTTPTFHNIIRDVFLHIQLQFKPIVCSLYVVLFHSAALF